ncbi:hypothetical protein JCM30471_16810 [Desulfuromonas carbonis]|uniref:extracellular catalytic domain type 1 short-chain-length polyhydroxyalkanoate depolymerase n=1 Tax=Desulfuromonas sp. DDH964 TaxID=1823759 RepID=UPI00078D92C9|nr:PHB depolymerase family esterase [Desulfuromonas sp. DDH964]AMV73279.1 hypothetical protein DBW_2970 [Desulfuromonas sp. DDH964]
MTFRTCARRMTLLLFCLLTACTPLLPATEAIPPATYHLDLGTDARGWSRSARVHIPPGLGSDRAPLLVVIHGAFSTAAAMEQETGFSALADDEGFVVAYPEGIGLFGYLAHWNAGHCCAKAVAEDWDDVGTVLRLLATLDQRLPIDRSRVYLAGMSNGGMLVYRLAAEHPEVFAAAAVMSGAIGSSVEGVTSWTLPTPALPVPFLIAHGRADRHIPFAGGPSPLKGGERSYRSFDDAIAFWRAADGCNEGPDQISWNAGAIETRTWTDCRAWSQVRAVALTDWGHVWPGPTAIAALPAGDPLRRFDYGLACWSFLSQFRRPGLGTEP